MRLNRHDKMNTTSARAQENLRHMIKVDFEKRNPEIGSVVPIRSNPANVPASMFVLVAPGALLAKPFDADDIIMNVGNCYR